MSKGSTRRPRDNRYCTAEQEAQRYALAFGENGIPAYGSICSDCAERLGGTCSEVHYATSWTGVCDVGDYEWPDGKRRGLRD